MFSYKIVQSVVYLILLLYLFLGIAIVSDIFMCAIEQITSSTRLITIKCATSNEYIQKEVKIWNESVANLTLMALGSSAPEILLSIIEIVGGGFNAGDLGAGTIVGSAAFNLLIITGVCIISIPNQEVRKIKSFKVFLVTSFFSIFAYVWLLLILVFISPEIIELWEALITFLFFPILTLIAFSADKNFFMGHADDDNDSADNMNGNMSESGAKDANILAGNYFPKGKLTKKNLSKFISDIKRLDPNISDEDAACLAAVNLFEHQPKSRLYYRVSAVRSLSGSKNPIPRLSAELQAVYDLFKSGFKSDSRPFQNNLSILSNIKPNSKSYNLNQGFDGQSVDTSFINDDNNINMSNNSKSQLMKSDSTTAAEHANYKGMAVVQFDVPTMTVLESEPFVTVTLKRFGKLDNKFSVFVETIDRTAIKNIDYIPLSSEVTFNPGQEEERIKISIIDNDEWNPDKVFLVKLSLTEESINLTDVSKGRICIMSVVIIDDDDPGTVTFGARLITIGSSDVIHPTGGQGSNNNLKKIIIPITRENGSDGQIKLKYKTIDGTAKAGQHFMGIGSESELTIRHKQTRSNIMLTIFDKVFDDTNDDDSDLFFEIELTSCEPSSCLASAKYSKTMIVFNHSEQNLKAIKLYQKIKSQQEGFKLNVPAWKLQIQQAMMVNGGGDDGAEDGSADGANDNNNSGDRSDKSTFKDYVLHVLSFQWKVALAILIPPTNIYGGWLSFFCSLTVIGILTAIIGDVATTFGCLVGLEKSINAITFVAMGTSLPDLFASRTAARMDSFADNAIGNVTGSNSVNVFLGLGLPWLLAAIYWSIKGSKFRVPSGNLAFSVALYSIIAFIAIATIIMRRYVPCFGGELGGPKVWAFATSFMFIFLWLFYVTLSALQAYNVLGM